VGGPWFSFLLFILLIYGTYAFKIKLKALFVSYCGVKVVISRDKIMIIFVKKYWTTLMKAVTLRLICGFMPEMLIKI